MKALYHAAMAFHWDTQWLSDVPFWCPVVYCNMATFNNVVRLMGPGNSAHACQRRNICP